MSYVSEIINDLFNYSNYPECQKEYVDRMRAEFMNNINMPLQISPLIMLRTIQEADYELNEDEIPSQNNVLPCEIYVTKERNKKNLKDEKRRDQKDENILDPELYGFL